MRVLRRVVTILLLVLLISPFRADSQPAQKTSTIGILAMEAWRPIESLRQGLRDLVSNLARPGGNITRPQAVLVIRDPFLSFQRRRLAQFVLKARLPSADTYREHAEAGGLLAYTPNYPDLFLPRSPSCEPIS